MNYTCQKCNCSMDENKFYTYKDGSKTELCKRCLTMHIDNYNPDTFLWILEKMDIPYIPAEWNTLRDRAFEKDPKKMNGMSVFGKYLSKMKLVQWKNYTWADTEHFVKEAENKIEQAKQMAQNLETDLKERYEKGEINEAQYKTLMAADKQYKEYIEQSKYDNGISEVNNPYIEKRYVNLSNIPDPAEDLTEDDMIYLTVKWGKDYTPQEWIFLEQKEQEMMKSFDIQDADSKNTLMLICKTLLKVNQAVDSNDMDSYNKLIKVYNDLRKTAKFTAMQNKEKKDEFIDSVGQLVAYCEQHGGQIPEHHIDAPQDVIDVILQDNKNYLKSLVYSDVTLAAQIESYLKKREQADADKRAKELKILEGKQDDDEEETLKDNDYIEYFDEIERQLDEDSEVDNHEFK